MQTSLALALLLAATPLVAQTPLELRYDRAARTFEETLPLGNGRVGAAVYGGAQREHINLNDITLWSGRPVSTRRSPDVGDNLAAVRAALAAQQVAAR